MFSCSHTPEANWSYDEAFLNPESVYFNPEDKNIYVSNVSGGGTEKNGMGYISKLNKDGVLISEDTEICRKLFARLECQVVFVKDKIKWPLKVLGDYNRMNASLATKAAEFLNIPEKISKKSNRQTKFHNFAIYFCE